MAGLQAIATAGRLGAVVEAYDVRPAVKEQVESVGAKFVELPLETGGAEAQGGYAKAMGEEFYRRQRELLKQVVAQSDAVITTALVPGRQAPVLITAEMVEAMKPGSVIVDLAAEKGGNCELTHPGERYVEHGVMIIGTTNVPASVPLSRQSNVCPHAGGVPDPPGQGRPVGDRPRRRDHSRNTCSPGRRSRPPTHQGTVGRRLGSVPSLNIMNSRQNISTLWIYSLQVPKGRQKSPQWRFCQSPGDDHSPSAGRWSRARRARLASA